MRVSALGSLDGESLVKSLGEFLLGLAREKTAMREVLRFASSCGKSRASVRGKWRFSAALRWFSKVSGSLIEGSFLKFVSYRVMEAISFDGEVLVVDKQAITLLIFTTTMLT